jgi:hypothetical protein
VRWRLAALGPGYSCPGVVLLAGKPAGGVALDVTSSRGGEREEMVIKGAYRTAGKPEERTLQRLGVMCRRGRTLISLATNGPLHLQVLCFPHRLVTWNDKQPM